MLANLRIQTAVLLIMVVLITAAAVAYTFLILDARRSGLLAEADARLLTAARFARALVGDDYHDRINGTDPVTEDEFRAVVDQYDRLCLDLGLQYLWSVMVLDDQLVFTSATHTDKTDAESDCATFLELHSNPAAYAAALDTMQVQYTTFHDEWGAGRMVLIPSVDDRGRKHLFAASVQLSELGALLARTVREVVLVSLAVLLVAVIIGHFLARSIAAPVAALTKTAERMAGGDLEAAPRARGPREIVSLSRSLDAMRREVRRQMELLRAGEENLAITLDSIGDAVIVTDDKGAITRMNPVAESLTGWREDEAIDRPLTEVFRIVNAVTKETATNPAETVLREGKAVGLADHTALIARDGTELQIADSGGPIRNAEGDIVGVVLVFRDVTVQYRDEAERRRLAAILETTSDLVSTSDMDGRLSYMNSAGRALVGWRRDVDITSRSIPHLHPAWATDIIRNEGIPSAIRDGIWSGETALQRADGAVIPVSQVIMAHRRPDGAAEYLSTIMRDISERQGVEEALRESRRQYRMLFEEMIDGMSLHEIICDEHGEPCDYRFIDVNPAFEKLTGLRAGDIVGKTVLEVLPGTESYWIEICGRVALTGEPARFENYSAEMKRHYQVAAFCPEPGKFAAIFVDITDRRRAEEAARTQAESERLLLRELDHRVRNNLTSLISLIDLSRASAGTVEEMAESIRSRTQAIATVHSVLSRSKWQAVDLRTLLASLINPLSRAAVSLDGPDMVVPLAQAQAMGIVLNELSMNSAKHGAMSVPGGAVRVTWESKSARDGAAIDLTLNWEEIGGPPVHAAPSAGVGTELMRGLVETELRGSVVFSYPEQGASHRFQFTLGEESTAQFHAHGRWDD